MCKIYYIIEIDIIQNALNTTLSYFICFHWHAMEFNWDLMRQMSDILRIIMTRRRIEVVGWVYTKYFQISVNLRHDIG